MLTDMHLKRKKILAQIYKLHDDFVQELDIACKKYCSHCCTRNVIITTLEADEIVDSLISKKEGNLIEKLKNEVARARFIPKTTTNMLAVLCANGKDIPEEESDVSWGSCPFLIDNKCPIYEKRPFGCRCFVSTADCSKKGYAQINPFVVTVNNLFLQFIEHIDSQGYSGNFTDVILYTKAKRDNFPKNSALPEIFRDKLIKNHPITFLPIPPEDKVRIKPILQALQNIRF